MTNSGDNCQAHGAALTESSPRQPTSAVGSLLIVVLLSFSLVFGGVPWGELLLIAIVAGAPLDATSLATLGLSSVWLLLSAITDNLLGLFVLSQLLMIVVGALPKDWWWSHIANEEEKRLAAMGHLLEWRS